MTAVNCPLCVLRFPTKTERDWHMRNDHQQVHVRPPTEHPLRWTGPRRSGPGGQLDPEQAPEQAEEQG